MLYQSRTAIRSLAGIFLFVGLAACSSNRQTKSDLTQLSHDSSEPAEFRAAGDRRIHQFYFYPQSNVYRDCKIDQWFWLHSGQWQVGSTLPDFVVLEVDPPLVVEWHSSTPYSHFEMIAASGSARSEPAHSTTRAVSADGNH